MLFAPPSSVWKILPDERVRGRAGVRDGVGLRQALPDLGQGDLVLGLRRILPDERASQPERRKCCGSDTHEACVPKVPERPERTPSSWACPPILA